MRAVDFVSIALSMRSGHLIDTMAKTKFIFFDLGKVLLNFEHQRLIDNVAKLASLSTEQVETLLFQPPYDLENRFERGELHSVDFHARFEDLTGRSVEHDALMDAVADIFWLNTPIVHVVTQLRAVNFPMAILSNTCSAHWNWARRNFAIVEQLFSQAVLSYEKQSMKPDAKIYQAAIAMAQERIGCEPSEIFFTDDKPENVAAAIEAGINAKLYESPQKLLQQLRTSGVKINL